MEPTPPALKVWSLNHWTAREVPLSYFKKKKNCLFLTVLDLTSCVVFSLVVTSGGYSLLGVHGLLIVVASPVAEHRLDGGGPRGDLL